MIFRREVLSVALLLPGRPRRRRLHCGAGAQHRRTYREAITHRAYDRFIPWSSFKLSLAVLVLSSRIRDRAMVKQPAWAAPISF